jgi:hypothetical protein
MVILFFVAFVFAVLIGFFIYRVVKNKRPGESWPAAIGDTIDGAIDAITGDDGFGGDGGGSGGSSND